MLHLSLSIELPYGLDDLDKVFQVLEFLENKEELLQEFKPEVSKFLVKKGFFVGVFKKTYDSAFDDLIIRLIKSQLVKHFPSFTPEEILLLTDRNFLKLITDDCFFKQENYKDVKNESAH